MVKLISSEVGMGECHVGVLDFLLSVDFEFFCLVMIDDTFLMFR